MTETDEEELPLKPFTAPPVGDYETILPIISQGVGAVVDAMDRSGVDANEIVEVLARDHHVRVDEVSVRRYLHHVKVVRASAPTATNAYLDAAIKQRHEELQIEAPEDLRRFDTAIDFLDRVVRGDPTAVGEKATVEVTDRGKILQSAGLTDAVLLKERVQAAKAIGPLIALKYKLTGKRIDGEREQTAQETLDETLKIVYGPTAKRLTG